MKTPKTYRMDETALSDLKEIQSYLQDKTPYTNITETDVLHRAIFNYFYMLFGTRDGLEEHIKRERGE